MGKTERAIFAAGCFWGVEETFRCRAGVVSTSVGYSGGHTPNPTYASVCHGDTEHAEAVQIDFDPDIISYAELLNIFWRCHDPTQKNRQGPDIGRQYRSAIFFLSEEQHIRAEKSRLDVQKDYPKLIMTEIVKAGIFYLAEEAHQQYLAKRRGF